MARSATSDDSKSHFATPKEYYTLISQRIDPSCAFSNYALLIWFYTQLIKDLLLTKKEAFFVIYVFFCTFAHLLNRYVI